MKPPHPLTFLQGYHTGNRLNWLGYAGLLLLCLVLYLPGFFTLPPTDRDESRFAQASKQMVESGNYIDIRFMEESRYKKPIGIYWLQAASTKFFGTHELNQIWTYRIPSLLGAIAAVLLTGFFAGRLLGARGGIVAASMLACCLLLNIEARLAKTDTILLACITASQFLLMQIYLAARSNQTAPLRYAVIFWLLLGIGILVKGPISLLIAGLTIITLGIADRNISWLKQLRPLAGLPLLALVVAPWLVAISLESNGVFWRESVGHDLLGKIFQGQDRGFVPPGLHTLFSFGTFWPFSLLALLALPVLWRRRGEPMIRFGLAWIIPFWIFFELIFTKLPHYILPVYPAAALLTAKIWLDQFNPVTTLPRWYRLGVTLLWTLTTVGLIAAVSWLVYTDARIIWVQHALLVVIALTAVIVALDQMRQQHTTNMIAALIIAGIAFTQTLVGWVLPNLQQPWIARNVYAAMQPYLPCPDLPPHLITAGFNEPSIVFMAGTKTIFANQGDKAVAALQRDGCAMALIEKSQLDSFNTATPNRNQLQHLTVISGFNYNGGDELEFHLYRLKP
jgi:4-amino-4-deoxy-L-arabinose transferase-like glycosyltransferase